jgi:hypothetical protein
MNELPSIVGVLHIFLCTVQGMYTIFRWSLDYYQKENEFESSVDDDAQDQIHGR